MENSEIKIYQSENGQAEVHVKFDKETVWLSQKQMAQLFGKDVDTIGLHLRNIYKSEELEESATAEESSVVQIEGKREVRRKVKLYNLDAIISVGYKVNSKRGIQFRIWATNVLKDYLVKGFSLNEKRLVQENKQLKELQKSIKGGSKNSFFSKFSERYQEPVTISCENDIQMKDKSL
ncbi:MAG: RhuM family protein [Bacteroidales bacterium]|nr:RhuM family protein [Bacteroidales bacterium]